MAEETNPAEQNGNGSVSGDSIRDTLMSKEVLIPAALSAVGAVVATKGPDLFKRITEATEAMGEDEAQQLGQKAAEGAKKGLTGNGLVGSLASKVMPGGGGGSG